VGTTLRFDRKFSAYRFRWIAAKRGPVAANRASRRKLCAGGLARLNSRLETGIRSPLDTAILAEVPPGDGEECTKLDELPFDFERRRLSVVVKHAGGNLLITKGAPDSVCSVCRGDAPSRERWLAWVARAGGRGLRVLAVATKPAGEGSHWTTRDERDLVLEGFLTFSDPPLPEAKEAVEALRRDGVSIKILSGDDAAVAGHVCGALGIDGSDVVLGADVERMTDTALMQVAERATVFARTSPAQKTRILLALKRRGHVVGFMGDGINDAPSLHGPISSAFDFLTFFVLLRVFHAGQAFFQTGWFVESLCTQTLVLFVIRTYERPWRSRPSAALAATVIAVAAIGIAIPATPRAPLLGFVHLPASYFVFVALATGVYLTAVELAKRALVRHGRFGVT
jgi:magnesium-transporting ATPase (P-type)